MIKSEILEMIRNWTPDNDSVNMLKELIDLYGGLNEDILKIFYVMDPYAIKYGDYSCETFAEYFGVIAIDFEGNCLYNDGKDVKSILELQNEFKNVIN